MLSKRPTARRVRSPRGRRAGDLEPRVYHSLSTEPKCHQQSLLLLPLRVPVLQKEVAKSVLLASKAHNHRDRVFPSLLSITSHKILFRTCSSMMPLSNCPRIILSRYIKLYIISERITQRWLLCKCLKASKCLAVPLRTSSKGEHLSLTTYEA